MWKGHGVEAGQRLTARFVFFSWELCKFMISILGSEKESKHVMVLPDKPLCCGFFLCLFISVVWAGISRYDALDVSYTHHLRFGIITAEDFLFGGDQSYVRINGR